MAGHRSSLEAERVVRGFEPRPVSQAGVSDPRTSLMEAASAAGIPPERFQPVGQARWRALLAEILGRFTRHRDQHPWLWDDLKEVPSTLALGEPAESLRALPLVLPERTPAWFLAEDFSGGKRHSAFWLFDTDTDALVHVLGEHHLFEYAVVGRHLEWLVAENHHNTLFAVGEPVVSRLEVVRALSHAAGGHSHQ